MEVATIYVDTSFKNGLCCSGYIAVVGKDLIEESSEVFECANNNDAEVMGIFLASKAAIDLIKNKKPWSTSYRFTVYCDNMVAISVTDSTYTASKKAMGKHELVTEIKEWCLVNNVTLQCNRMKRTNPMIKQCDKMSKRFRKDVRWRKRVYGEK